MKLAALPTRLFAVMCLLAVVAVAPAAAQKRNARVAAEPAPVAEQREAAPAVFTAEPSVKIDPAPLAPTPIPFPPDDQGTLTCRDLNRKYQSQFPAVAEDFEFKLDFNPPTGTTGYLLNGSNGGSLEGGFPGDDGTLQ